MLWKKDNGKKKKKNEIFVTVLLKIFGRNSIILTKGQVAFSQKKLEASRSCELCRMESVSNKLYMWNLEMIDDKKKTKDMAKNQLFTSPSKFFTFPKIH